MALFTIGAQLAAVDIGMAVLAALSHIRENRPGVTLRASHRLVHAPKWVARLIVIEFRSRPNRPPSARCVTVLAGDVQTPMRAMRTSGYLRSCASQHAQTHQQKNCTGFQYGPSTPHASPLALGALQQL